MDLDTKFARWSDMWRDEPAIAGSAMMEIQAEMERLHAALEPFALASEIAARALGPAADTNHVEAVAKTYIGLHDMKEAARALGRVKP